MNQLNGSTFYIDTVYGGDATQDYVKKGVLASWIMVTATAANARIVLADTSPNSIPKFDLRVAVSGDSKLFHFRGINVMFSNGIRVLTLTNAIVTIGVTNSGS